MRARSVNSSYIAPWCRVAGAMRAGGARSYDCRPTRLELSAGWWSAANSHVRSNTRSPPAASSEGELRNESFDSQQPVAAAGRGGPFRPDIHRPAVAPDTSQQDPVFVLGLLAVASNPRITLEGRGAGTLSVLARDAGVGSGTWCRDGSAPIVCHSASSGVGDEKRS